MLNVLSALAFWALPTEWCAHRFSFRFTFPLRDARCTGSSDDTLPHYISWKWMLVGLHRSHRDRGQQRANEQQHEPTRTLYLFQSLRTFLFSNALSLSLSSAFFSVSSCILLPSHRCIQPDAPAKQHTIQNCQQSDRQSSIISFSTGHRSAIWAI